MAAACPHCACTSANGTGAHAMLALVAKHDLDAALELGLLEAVACPECQPACNARLYGARDARRTAVAARERYRNRSQRLARRKAARVAARTPPAATTASPMPALPAAAADALARALAKAGGRKQP